MRLLLLLLVFPALFFAQQNGYDPNWFVPDIVTTKDDPYLLISSNHGQPGGRFHWNSDQFQLMNRSRTSCQGCTSGGRDIIIKDLKLYVNDSEYFIKAVCYHPVPLGIKTPNGGLCSIRNMAQDNGEISACVDHDFFDGSVIQGRTPPSPPNGWFKGIWERDFPIIKSMGANTIRMYHTSPITKLYMDDVAAGKQTSVHQNLIGVNPMKDHRLFMDTALKYNLMVIFPLLGDENLMRNTQAEIYYRLLQNQIDEIGNHPALLMFTLGNELNLGDQVLLDKVNDYIRFSRNYTRNRWGRTIPITHAIVDNPFSYNHLFQVLEVDIFTSNAGYRGLGFQDLWDGKQTNGFDGLGALSAKYNKPNFIGEMGWMQLNGTETSQPSNSGWFNLKWKDLIEKGAVAGCIGGAFFEYMDETETKADPLQQTMGTVSSRVSSVRDYPSTTGTPGSPSFASWNVPAGSTNQNVGTNIGSNTAHALSSQQENPSDSLSTISMMGSVAFFALYALL